MIFQVAKIMKIKKIPVSVLWYIGSKENQQPPPALFIYLSLLPHAFLFFSPLGISTGRELRCENLSVQHHPEREAHRSFLWISSLYWGGCHISHLHMMWLKPMLSFLQKILLCGWCQYIKSFYCMKTWILRKSVVFFLNGNNSIHLE